MLKFSLITKKIGILVRILTVMSMSLVFPITATTHVGVKTTSSASLIELIYEAALSDPLHMMNLS